MSLHKDKKRGTWYFRKRVIDIDGVAKNFGRYGFKTKSEAKIAEAEFDFLDSQNLNIRLHQLIDHYLEHQKDKLKYSSIYTKKKVMSKWIKPYFKNGFADKIKTEHIKRWIDIVKKSNCKIRTINRFISELRLVFEHGEKFFGLKQNPVTLFGSLKDNSPRNRDMQIFCLDDFNLFIDKIDNKTYKNIFLLLYYTGIRIGELRALTWNDFNSFTNRITISKTISNKHDDKYNNKYLVTGPKNTSSNRYIDLPDKVAISLKEYKNFIQEEYGKFRGSSFIFGIDNPIGETNIKRAKDKACENATLPKIRIHDFRHSHASLLLSMQIDPLFIADRLGHSNVSTTLDTYSHLMPGKQKEIIALLNKF